MLDKAKGLIDRINWPLTILIIAIIWLAVGIGLLCTYRLWNWLVLYGFATWVLAGGVGAAFWQIREARKSTNAQLAAQLFRELRSEETKNILRFIYKLRPERVQSLCRTDMNSIDGVLDKFELLGALVKQGIIDKRLAIEVFAGPPALRCWHQLAEYIKNERKDRGFFVKNYEKFTQQTVKYCKDHKIRVAFGNIKDLADHFKKGEFKYPPGKIDEIINQEREGKL
ncbi:MAG TPA: hypothetical protein G4O01_02025 [Dehalococcoidia bacterium]|jgi:hypothetical protein|nr:hypothetical protein [Dehalococcoidia bacterium]